MIISIGISIRRELCRSGSDTRDCWGGEGGYDGMGRTDNVIADTQTDLAKWRFKAGQRGTCTERL